MARKGLGGGAVGGLAGIRSRRGGVVAPIASGQQQNEKCGAKQAAQQRAECAHGQSPRRNECEKCAPERRCYVERRDAVEPIGGVLSSQQLSVPAAALFSGISVAAAKCLFPAGLSGFGAKAPIANSEPVPADLVTGLKHPIAMRGKMSPASTPLLRVLRGDPAAVQNSGIRIAPGALRWRRKKPPSESAV